MKLYSSNETTKTSTLNISNTGSLETFFASKTNPIEMLGDTSQNGTPTPSSPVDINNVTGRQKIDVVGQNYFDYTDQNNVNPLITTDNDGWITGTYNNTGSSTVFLNYFTHNLKLKPNTQYAIMLEVQSVNGNAELYLATTISGSQSSENKSVGFSILENNKTYKYTFTTSNDFSLDVGIRSYLRFASGRSGSITFRLSVLSDLSITADNFIYEPYINNTYEIDLVDKSSTNLMLNASYISFPDYPAKSCAIINNLDTNSDYLLSYDWENINPTLSGINKVEIWDYSFTSKIAEKEDGSSISFNTGSYNIIGIVFKAIDNATDSALRVFNSVNIQVSQKQGSNTYQVAYNNLYLSKKAPIELCKLDTYQDRIFKSSGKNLFSGNYSQFDSTGGTGTTYGYFALPTSNEKYTLTLIAKNNFTGTSTTYLGFTAKGGNATGGIKWAMLDGKVVTKGEKITIDNVYSGGYYNFVSIYSNFSTTLKTFTDNFYIQLEKGEATSYEPYGDHSWYIEENVGKLLLNGSESYELVELEGQKCYLLSPTFSNAKTPYISNRFKSIAANADEEDNAFKLNIVKAFQFDYNSANDVNAFKTWVSNNNIKIYYAHATPTYTKITNNDLITQLESVLNLYKGINNISITSTELPADLIIQYRDGFKTNGLGFINDVLEAKVTEQINGDYCLDFKVPTNIKLADDITYDNIVSCKVADGTEQFFRIKRVVKDFNTMSVYATHIFYDLLDNVLRNIAPTNKMCVDYGRWILSNANYWTPFVFNSNILISNSGRYIRKNIVEAMIGNIDNSMLAKFGGEIVRDNFDIALNYNRGQDKGVKLLFGKNISAIEITTDIESTATRIIPVGFDGLMIPETYIDSPLINDYPLPKMAVVEFSDIKYEPIEDGKEPSADAYHDLEEAYQALRDRVNELYNNGVDKPSINIKIDWVELSKTNEYSNYTNLEKVNIGDILQASILGTNYKTEVIKTIYNVLTDRIENFEIGSISGSIVSAVNGNAQAIQNFSASEILSSASNTTQQQIINALGGTYGQVGGFKISADKLWTEYYPPADFTSTDITKVRNYILDPVQNPLTDEEKALYDLFGDGVVNAKDLLYMTRLVELGITTSNPLKLEMRSGANVMDSAFAIEDGNNNHITDMNINGILSKNEIVTKQVYEIGDKYYVTNYIANGFVSNSTKDVVISIPFDGVIKSGTPTITGGTFLFRSISGYMNTDQAGSTISVPTTGYTFNVLTYDSNYLTIYIAKSSAYATASNNRPVAVTITNLEITFNS